MAYISVTNQFVNSTLAKSADVNQNFTDIINGLKDGTKDLNIKDLAVSGTLTAAATNLPTGTPTAKGNVKSGYSYIQYIAAASNFTSSGNRMYVAGAPTLVGDAVLSVSGAAALLTITAVQKCIVNVSLSLESTELTVLKNNALIVNTVIGAGVTFNAIFTTQYLGVGDYLTFNGSGVGASNSGALNVTAIQVQ
jgi:hypothetical protein